MHAAILIGHGSLRADSGAAMIRLAARASAAGVAPLVAPAFLNYSRPTLPQALARCAARGAEEVVLLPYFLAPGWFVHTALPKLLGESLAAHPRLRARIAPPLGDHPALAALVHKRADAALAADGQSEAPALLLVAHGSPDPSANRPIAAVAERLRGGPYADVTLCFLGLNEPLLGPAIDAQAAAGHRRLVVVPYFLQLGGHVAEDLPAAITEARQRHPAATIALAEHLAYDPLLVEVLGERMRDA
ncbi:MAG TPA: sirohydrochlorin chelatase [Roseiflexaceae bacterium]|nr:sirohydrochlorin chelatase [Roseiflexaceae bacterium]